MTNSTFLIGGIPGSSSGKTSGKSRTTGMFSIPSKLRHSYIQCIDLPFSILGNSSGVVNNLAGGVKELDGFGATIEGSIVNFQPIHSQNEVYGGRLQNDGGNKEYNPFDLTGDIGY